MGFPIDGGLGARSVAANTIQNHISNYTVTPWDVQMAARICTQARADFRRAEFSGNPFAMQAFENRFENAQILYQQAFQTLQSERMDGMGYQQPGLPFIRDTPGDGAFNYQVPNYNPVPNYNYNSGNGPSAGEVIGGIAAGAVAYGLLSTLFKNEYRQPNCFQYRHWEQQQRHYQPPPPQWGPHRR